jgi:hypothetical protein
MQKFVTRHVCEKRFFGFFVGFRARLASKFAKRVNTVHFFGQKINRNLPFSVIGQFSPVYTPHWVQLKSAKNNMS